MPNTPVPADLAARMTSMLNRMTTRGMTEPVNVYGRLTQTDGSGNAVARPRELLLILTAYVAIGGGQITLAQDGTRIASTDQLYFLPDNTGILTEDTFMERWVILPNRSNDFRRIATLQNVGPYCWAQLESGGGADIAGNLR